MHYSFPFKTTLTLSLILIFLSSCNSQSPTYPPYEISGNSITIKSYSSNLTNEQRQEYQYWIGIRNSFYYSKNENKYAKVIKYFTPENSNYYPNIYLFSYPFYIIATLIGALILYYLVMRFLFRRCQGPKKVVENSYEYFVWGLIALGSAIALVFFYMGIYHLGKQNSFLSKTISYVDQTNQELKSITQNLTQHQQVLADTNYVLQNESFTKQVHDINIITEDQTNITNRFTQFVTDIKTIHNPNFIFCICFVVALPFLVGGGIGSYWLHREWIPWLISLALFIVTIPLLVIVGKQSAYTFLTTDFCQTIGNSIKSGIIPSESNGLGTYMTCPSKDARRSMNTAIYELSSSFNAIADDINTTLHNNNKTLGVYKRDNEHFKTLKHELKDDNYTTIRSGLDCLITTNELLAELLYMSKCTPAEKNINYIEEAMCHQIFKHFGYFVLYYFIGVIGLIILGVGFNKLILVLRKLQKTSVRGNKQFKDEFEDD